MKEEVQEKPLNGTDIEAKVDEKVDAKVDEKMKVFEKDFEHKRTKEKLIEQQDKNNSAEQYIEILENRIEAMQAKPNHFGSWDLGKLAASTIEGIAVHYPKILDKVPVLNGIAKVIQEDTKNKTPQLNGGFEGDVSFKAKEKNETTQLTPYQKQILVLGEFISTHFETDQIRLLGLVIEALGEDTSKLQTVAELLDIKSAGESTEETDEAEEITETK